MTDFTSIFCSMCANDTFMGCSLKEPEKDCLYKDAVVVSRTYLECLKNIIEKVKNYDRLNQDKSNHIHADSLVYDIKKILWEYLLDSDPRKRVYFYPTFWEILEKEGESVGK